MQKFCGHVYPLDHCWKLSLTKQVLQSPLNQQLMPPLRVLGQRTAPGPRPVGRVVHQRRQLHRRHRRHHGRPVDHPNGQPWHEPHGAGEEHQRHEPLQGDGGSPLPPSFGLLLRLFLLPSNAKSPPIPSVSTIFVSLLALSSAFKTIHRPGGPGAPLERSIL